MLSDKVVPVYHCAPLSLALRGCFAFRGVPLLPPIAPRPGDGRISRADAALLAGVECDTISSWICKGWLTDVRREGRRVWLMPAEVIAVEFRVHAAERARDERRRARMELLGGMPADAA